ncbi:MAG: hypothetical protein BWK76_04810 [Desulfobulbaceae bacterium A2]|nr:MAG: hypothetical protein BWK76_04810 [Desulfobulbaceae bacterium A2]
MDLDEHNLKQRLRAWRVEEPAENLAERIVTQATALPQRLPWGLRVQQALTVAFTDWRWGWSYKLACLLLCALIGFGSGLHQQAPTSVDVSTLIIGEGQEGEQG